MAFEDDRSRSININVAVNAAADITCAIIKANSEVNWTDENAADVFKSIAALTVASVLEVHGENALAAAFPGADLVPDVTNVVQLPQAVTQAMPMQQVAAPAPIPGVQDGDPVVAALWQEYFQDPSKFYDNRNNKRNPAGPDFSHKVKKGADGKYAAGLWIQGRKGANPSWVAPQLAARGIA